MKKTLIALMALAGVAVGNNDFTVVKGDNWWASEISGLTFVIESVDNLSEDGIILAAFGGGDYGNYLGTNVFKLNETDGAITLQVGVGTLTGGTAGVETGTKNILPGAGVTWIDGYNNPSNGNYGRVQAFETTIKRDVYYTISGVGTSQNLTLTLSWNEGSETLTTYNGNVNGQGDPVARLNQNYIPEPATATLSLLALAGLAARRRRK